jgi:Leucine Rich repeat
MTLTLDSLINRYSKNTCELDLYGMKLSDDDIALLCVFLTNHTKIDTLFLSLNSIGNSGAQQLALIQTIKVLDLSRNIIAAQGAASLAQNNNITSLNLSNNGIEDEGAIALSKNKSIKYLDVSYNYIGYEGAIALATNPNLNYLKVISYNNIDKNTAKLLKEKAPIKRINNARNTRVQTDVPSLKTLSCFFIQNNKELSTLARQKGQLPEQIDVFMTQTIL